MQGLTKGKIAREIRRTIPQFVCSRTRVDPESELTQLLNVSCCPGDTADSLPLKARDGSLECDGVRNTLYGNGCWYALYSIARKEHRQLACLAFENNGVVTEDTKAEMWRILGPAEKLSREPLAEHLKAAER